MNRVSPSPPATAPRSSEPRVSLPSALLNALAEDDSDSDNEQPAVKASRAKAPTALVPPIPDPSSAPAHAHDGTAPAAPAVQFIAKTHEADSTSAVDAEPTVQTRLVRMHRLVFGKCWPLFGLARIATEHGRAAVTPGFLQCLQFWGMDLASSLLLVCTLRSTTR
jgi:hypothetical protein